MTMTTWDPTKIRARSGKIFVLAYPYSAAAPPTGSTPAQILKTYLSNFYLDGEKETALSPVLAPWAYIDAKGFALDMKFKQVMFDPADGLPINAGKYIESCIGSTVIGDFSAAKLAELISATSGEILTLAAGTGQAARTAVLFGTQPYNTRYMVLYQFGSLDTAGKPIVGQFDNLLIPRCFMDVDVKSEFVKSKPTDLPIKVTAESDLFLVSPDSGKYACAVFQETTAAATS